jgi:clan AA aspartic protease (TIGR02281 family)
MWGMRYFHNRAAIMLSACVSHLPEATSRDPAAGVITAATWITAVAAAIRHRLGVDPNTNRTLPECKRPTPVRRAAGLFVVFVAALLGVGMPSVHAESVALTREHGAFVLPVVMNGRITRNFMIDSGATDVTISAEVLAALTRAGTIATTDFLDSQVYQLADGSKTRTQRVRIRSLRVGGVELKDVIVSVAPHADLLLLGQSFLGRLQSWAIDNQRHLFAINEAIKPAATPIIASAPPVASAPLVASAPPVAKHETMSAADDWLSIGHSKDGLQTLYVNRSSVRVRDGIPRAWFKTTFSPHTVKGFGRRNKWMSAIIARDAFDCGRAAGRTEAATEYYDDGTNYPVPATELPASWSFVQPGTGLNNEMGVTCKLASTRRVSTGP